MSASEDDLSPVEDDLEIIEEPENTEPVNQTNEAEEANQNEGEGEAETGDKKEVKVKRVRNPQPKLDVERLRGPRGLLMLDNVFKDVKFKGRGHEEEDLNVLMKNYEYWCHRLFPKFPFDDCLERMERLGSKKLLQTYLKRVRLNMLDNEEGLEPHNEGDVIHRDTDDDEDTQRSSFDDLLQPQTQTQVQPTKPNSTGLSEEQLERIRINRERAQRLRKQMLIKNQANSFSQSSSQNSQGVAENADVAVLSQNSSICRALEDVNFTENMSVDSESVSSPQTSSNLSEIGAIQSKIIGSPGKRSVAPGTATNQDSDDETGATQSSVNNESFRFETTIADVHATYANEEFPVSVSNSEASVGNAQNASVIINSTSIEHMSIDGSVASETASQSIVDCTSEDLAETIEHQKSVEDFEADGSKNKNQRQSSTDDLIMEIDEP